MRVVNGDVTHAATMPIAVWRLLLAVLARLPQHGLSRVVGRLADLHIPARLRRPVLGALTRLLRIDLSDAERPLAEYRTFNELFVRRLRRGARAIPHDDAVLASPVDAIVGQVGTVCTGLALQAKRRTYSIAELIDDPEEARNYEGGRYITLYLSPRHYHRIHSPCAGAIRSAHHIPGALMAVTPEATLLVPNLFARNERLVCSIDGTFGRVAVVAVGACNVGRISTAFDPTWRSGRGDDVRKRDAVRPESRRYTPPKRVEQGDEIMAFHLGSTVVLLVEHDAILEPVLTPGVEVRLGQPITRLT